MKIIFAVPVALLVSLVGVSYCQDGDGGDALTAVAASDAPSKCSCILPLVLLPGGGQVTSGILNNLLQAGLLNFNDANVIKYLLGGGQVTTGLLNNLLQGGLLNANDGSGTLNGQATGGILNNALQGGVGNGLLQALLSKGLLGNLLGGLLGAPATAAPPTTAAGLPTTAGDDIQASAPGSTGSTVGATPQSNSGLLSGLLGSNGIFLNALNNGYGPWSYGGAFSNAQDNSGLASGVLNSNLIEANLLNGIL